jgi:sugar (pentulose or hexulose) kinase
MSADLVALLDIGKTNSRVAFIDAHTGAEVWREQRANQIVGTPLGRELDVREIERWLLRALQQAPGKEHVFAVVPIAHGAAAVLVDRQGAIVVAPDYEDPQFELVNERYDRERDRFDQTFSPSLPLGLNLARQLFFFEQQYPAVFARVTHILPYPQYWAWRLGGVMASEVTSLGCHSDLWFPRDKTFSTLARARGWAQRFPPLRFAGDVVGIVTAEMAQRTGLSPACKILCGIHDSNASYLQHAIARPPGEPFAVISSGTWTIVMASGADPARLREDRDMLASADAFGTPVPTARFMGGREYDVIASSKADPDPRALAAVLQRQAMAVPAFASGGPFSGHPGKLVHAEHLDEPQRAAVATAYTTLMIDLLLDSLGAQGDTIVDGPLSANPLFAGLLATLRPASRILAAPARTSCGRAACYLAGIERPATQVAIASPPLQATGIEAYRAVWRTLLPARWPEIAAATPAPTRGSR